MQAVSCISNRIGGFVALLVIVAWMLNFGSWGFVCCLDFFLLGSVEMELISFFVVLAAITRNAHFPFCFCLPEAMGIPSRVSTLFHSSALVTADVCRLIRFSPSFS
jgi:NADH-ubiquinone oxidoreductase chain 5